MGLLTHLRLRMEHELCLEIPRLGEMIAFRKVFDRIPPDVAMDEAFVEALVVKQGLQVKLRPGRHRLQHGADHRAPTLCASAAATMPATSTSSTSTGMPSAASRTGASPAWPSRRCGASCNWCGCWSLLAGIEGYSRLMGWYDFAIKRDRHVVWDMAWTQKQNVQSVRETNQQRDESFVVQTRTQAERKV